MSGIPRAPQHVIEVKSEDCEVDVFLVDQALQEAQSQTGTTIQASTNTYNQRNLLEVQGIENVIKSVRERCETLQTIADQSARCLSIDADSNRKLLGDVAKLLSTCQHGLASLLQGQCCYYLLQGDYMQVYFYANELKDIATKLSNETFLKDAKSWASKKFVENNLNVSNQDTKLRLIKMQSEMLQNNLQFLQEWKSDEFAQRECSVLHKLYKKHFERCDFQRSLDLCKHLLQMSCGVRYKQGIIDTLADLASMYLALGKYWLSYTITKKMQVLEIEKIRARCVVTTTLSVVELLLTKPNSLQHARDSLDLALEANDPEYIACAHGNIGLAFEYLGNFNEAIEQYKECLRIGENAGNDRVINNGFCNLGRAYQGLGGNENKQAAKDYFKRAVETQPPPNAHWCDTEEFRFSGDYLLAKLAIEEKTWDDAVEHLREVIKRCEDLRRSIQDDRTKITFNDTQRKPFQYLQYVLLEQGKKMEALLIAEKGRGRVFSDNIESQVHMPLECENVLMEMIKSRGVAVLFISSLEEVGKLCFWFISSNGELLKHWWLPYAKCDALLGKLCMALPNTQGIHETEFGGSIAQEDYSLIDKAFNLILPNNDAYSTLSDQQVNERSSRLDTRNDTSAINTSRSPKCTKKLPSEDNYALPDLLDELSQLISSPFRDEFREEFVNNETNEIPRLLIIPQGKAFNIPFAALRIDGKPLCSHVSIIEAFSFNSFSYSSTESERRVNSGLIENALIVGNPTHDLPRAEEEAKLISEIFGVTPLLNVDATKEQVMKQLPSARLCHFACHGETDGKALVLASDNYHTSYRDCHLTASDVENMEINADLVVLSACHTARGTINSEGVLGLARAFQTAGARTVVTALWAIPEAATKVFMSYFYKNLRSGKPVADAIRATQVTMQESDDFKEVINWGSFKVFGANARIM